jgi:hypothetical protein
MVENIKVNQTSLINSNKQLCADCSADVSALIRFCDGSKSSRNITNPSLYKAINTTQELCVESANSIDYLVCISFPEDDMVLPCYQNLNCSINSDPNQLDCTFNNPQISRDLNPNSQGPRNLGTVIFGAFLLIWVSLWALYMLLKTDRGKKWFRCIPYEDYQQDPMMTQRDRNNGNGDDPDIVYALPQYCSEEDYHNSLVIIPGSHLDDDERPLSPPSYQDIFTSTQPNESNHSIQSTPNDQDNRNVPIEAELHAVPSETDTDHNPPPFTQQNTTSFTSTSVNSFRSTDETS